MAMMKPNQLTPIPKGIKITKITPAMVLAKYIAETAVLVQRRESKRRFVKMKQMK